MKINYPKDFQNKIEELKHQSSLLMHSMEDGSFYRLSIARRREQINRVKGLYNGLLGHMKMPELKGMLLATALLLSSTGCDLINLNHGQSPDRVSNNNPPDVPTLAHRSQITSSIFSFDASAATDPDGDALEFSWNFTGQNSGATYNSSTAAGSVDLSENDIFDVTLTVKDENGAANIQSAQFRHLAPAFTGSDGAATFGDLAAISTEPTFTFTDIDNDGDLDMFSIESTNYSSISGNDFYFHQNTGTAAAPNFAAPILANSAPYNITTANPMVNTAGLTFADMDGDGDVDMLHSEDATVLLTTNGGTADAPDFFPGRSSLTNFTPSAGTEKSVAAADLDNDGDQDLLLGLDTGYLQLHINQGTPEVHDFGNVTPGNMLDSSMATIDLGTGVVVQLADLDRDGDFDIFAGNNAGTLYFLENTGDPSNPVFAPPVSNGFGLTQAYSGPIIPATADIDGDGDRDLISVTYRNYSPYYDAYIQFFENTEF
ncbi:FG-GAP-like repeat-containing protein [Salinispira pacifica]|uniref:PKD domain-containing protein n=1 Tax=Salinispira pacifica TaxID=1307761 RepID=V5WKE6_9SPIO|nr:FG-GAP-like repeat-containing protein [Salinispira pacifica]AHC15666.1 hypothetical protein L21SP2_2309 [Salinispira pacifica]